jgi:hypothetical protein
MPVSKGSRCPQRPDDVFPTLALQHFPVWLGLFFIIGLISALFPSADGALTALTASTCIDLIGIRDRGWDEARSRSKCGNGSTLVMAALFLAVHPLFPLAGDTHRDQDPVRYRGLHLRSTCWGSSPTGCSSMGKPVERWVPLVCIAAPLITYVIRANSETLLFGYKMGFEVLLVVAGLTMVGMRLIDQGGKGNSERDPTSALGIPCTSMDGTHHPHNPLPMSTERFLLATMLSVALFVGCKKDEDEAATPNVPSTPTTNAMLAIFDQHVEDATQLFTLNAGTGGSIIGQDGVTMFFPPNAFRTQAGAVVTGSVQVELVEALTVGDMLWLNKRTLGNDNGQLRPLVSGGQYFLNVTQGGQQLRLAENAGFVNVPAPNGVDPNMQLFSGNVDGNPAAASSFRSPPAALRGWRCCWPRSPRRTPGLCWGGSR